MGDCEPIEPLRLGVAFDPIEPLRLGVAFDPIEPLRLGVWPSDLPPIEPLRLGFVPSSTFATSRIRDPIDGCRTGEGTLRPPPELGEPIEPERRGVVESLPPMELPRLGVTSTDKARLGVISMPKPSFLGVNSLESERLGVVSRPVHTLHCGVVSSSFRGVIGARFLTGGSFLETGLFCGGPCLSGLNSPSSDR